jgi:NAD(P)-dependent dehydrogenase (short-subunit alcohol dehydrogenase family)
VAGVDPSRPSSKDGAAASTIYADEAGLNAVLKAVNRASEINLTGTAMVLAAFVPMLQTTSTHPAISLTSSAAALFAAPTRSIYAATKSAQFSLFRSVAIECQAHAQIQSNSSAEGKNRADIRFLAVCPGTIATSFRASAVDLNHGDGLPDDSASGKKAEKMLTSETVAERTVLGVDKLERGMISMPIYYGIARWVELISPDFIAALARKKYNY